MTRIIARRMPLGYNTLRQPPPTDQRRSPLEEFFLRLITDYHYLTYPIVLVATFIEGETIVILLGAELNAEMEHQTVRDTTTGVPKPLGMRGARMADTVGAAQRG